ncbi:hypothetical protein FOA43_002835 [Brettanomyces nanus]|uniref:Transcription activator GCR1-like domain-containing protein n=1 Tax=Eeniella nana TaxID=13502 RepID=A0A875RPU5_EENNA|nr:uncharacterized protein FOA43_002835 [Brettanomyces nanus]QPG75480.1 hypothetical protein FOA43_002835 [Brettanomyces nanus]
MSTTSPKLYVDEVSNATKSLTKSNDSDANNNDIEGSTDITDVGEAVTTTGNTSSVNDNRVNATATAAAVAVASDDQKEQSSNDFFLAQLKDLTDLIVTSFDSIASNMEDLRIKAGTLSSLSATLIGSSGDSLSKTFSDRDIDSRLMLLEVAQKAQNDFSKSATDADLAVGNGSPTSGSYAAYHQQHVFSNQRRMDSPLDIPEIDLNPRAKSVPDIWDEWMNGYRSQKPLRYLEARYGTKWRRGRIAKSAQRRKKVIDFIVSESKRFSQKSPHDVVATLEEYRRRKNKGLFWLYGSLPSRLFDDNGNTLLDNDEADEDGSSSTSAAAAAAAAAVSAAQEEEERIELEGPARKKAKKLSDDQTTDSEAEVTAAAAAVVAAQRKAAQPDSTTDPALASIDNKGKKA